MRIFLSYRRDDAAGHAGRLYDTLADRFGAERVFIDVDDISLGSRFGDAISDAVASCDVLIALIGRSWLDAADADGQRRLMDPDDHLRREIEAAMAREVIVVPACVQGAAIPRKEDLPATLAPLAERQGIELRDTAWQDDVTRLIRRLGAGGGAPAAATAPERPARDATTPAADRRRGRARRLIAALAVAVLALVVALVAWPTGPEDEARPGNAAERRLLTMVPAITRPSCDRQTPEEGTEAQLDCGVGSTLSASYRLFADGPIADGWYTQARSAEGLSRTRGPCTANDFRGEAEYRVAGSKAGRYFCGLNSERFPLLVARADRTSVGLIAQGYHDTGRPGVENMLSLWECCIRVRP